MIIKNYGYENFNTTWRTGQCPESGKEWQQHPSQSLVGSVCSVWPVLDSCCLNDLADLELIMWEQATPLKTQPVRKLKTTSCKSKAQEKVTIPESWSLNDAQRSFIELMLDSNNK